MQRNAIETIMGAVVLFVAAGFLFFFYRTTDIGPQTGYELSARFSNIEGLTAGSAVKISGVKIGQVTDFEIDPKTYQAVIHLIINQDVKLPTDTAAIVASEGLLGGKFLSLQPGGAEEMLEAGSAIEYTQSTPGLEQLLGQVIFSLTKDDKKDDDANAAPATKKGPSIIDPITPPPADHP